jgi:hypothetical protein
MERAKKQTFRLLIQTVFVVASISLFATESPSQKIQKGQNKNLDSSEATIDVDDYLKRNQSQIYQTLQSLLSQAIKDSKYPEVNKVTNNLWALSTSNPKTKWRDNKGEKEVLMVTWMNLSGAWETSIKSKVNQRITLDQLTKGNRIWLTAFPQVKEFCHSCKGLRLNLPSQVMLPLRLQQYLGLKLESRKTYFVEMWVKASDLVRPCIDSEINDSSCNLLPHKIPESQQNLFKIQQESLAFPWTGLGYTYDWGYPQKPHIGASEFITRGTTPKDIEVEIVSVTKTEAYCNNKYLSSSNSIDR